MLKPPVKTPAEQNWVGNAASKEWCVDPSFLYITGPERFCPTPQDLIWMTIMTCEFQICICPDAHPEFGVPRTTWGYLIWQKIFIRPNYNSLMGLTCFAAFSISLAYQHYLSPTQCPTEAGRKLCTSHSCLVHTWRTDSQQSTGPPAPLLFTPKQTYPSTSPLPRSISLSHSFPVNLWHTSPMPAQSNLNCLCC